MNINFCAKLKVDDSVYKKLKYSNAQEIVDQTQKVLDIPQISRLITEDELTISGKRYVKGDCVQIQYGDDLIEISNSNGKVTAKDVIHQILLVTCFKHGKNPRSSLPKYVFETLAKITQEKFSN